MALTSKKHHYIPKFYLKNFTNEEGTFYVYLKDKGRFKKNGKMFNPDSHFFKNYGYSFEIEGEKKDFLETKFYKKLDDLTAKIFEKIKKESTNNNFGITNDEINLILYFIIHIIWRSPNKTNHARNLIEKYELKDIGFIVKQIETNIKLNNVELFKLWGIENLTKLIKLFIPNLLFNEYLKKGSILHIIDLETYQFPTIFGDNPIISKDLDIFNLAKSDFIFPIDKSKLLVQTKKKRTIFSQGDIFFLHMQIIRQADTFVCTTNKEYLEKIIEESNRLDDVQLKEIIFDSFCDYS